MQRLQNTFLKEKVLQERNGVHKFDVIQSISTEFSEALYEATVKSNWRTSRIFRPSLDRPGWRLTAGFKRHWSLDVVTRKEKLLGLAHAHIYTLFPSYPFKRPCPGMPNCLDTCIAAANLGSQRCWFLNSFAFKRSWKFEERCAAILFRTTTVMAVCAPDSDKSLEMYEAYISGVVGVLREGRRGGAKDFYKTGDLNVELGMICTDENDIEELVGICGPMCGQGHDKNPGGLKNMLLYEIMNELNCKASSTWSVCSKGREILASTGTWAQKRKRRADIAAGLHHRTDEKRWWNTHPQGREDMGNMGHHPFMQGYRREDKQIT